MHSEVLSNSLREARGSFKNWLLGEANDRTAAHNSDRVSTDVDLQNSLRILPMVFSSALLWLVSCSYGMVTLK
jgi:hypothetical protein